MFGQVPNIEGTVGIGESSNASLSGAFCELLEYSGNTQPADHGVDNAAKFKASASNAIYSGDKVQCAALCVLCCIKI